MSWKRWRATVLGGILLLTLVPEAVLAHGNGARYELGVPQWLFLLGGGAVVVLSFAAVSLFSGDDEGAFSYRSRRLSATPLRVLQSSAVVGPARAVAAGLLVTSVLAGLIGPQSDGANLLTNLVWIGFWIGYTFSVVLVGNSWPVLNPWKTCYRWATRLLDRDLTLDREYPLGHYPALAVFLGFAWLEIIAPVSESPRWMAGIVLAYSVYLWGGMAVFGMEPWLSNADPFTILYDYFGRFAPLSTGADAEVRPYGVGLVEEEALSEPGALALLVAALYTVTFDGFVGTPEWESIALAVPELPVQYATSTVLLLAGFVLFFETYITVAWLMAGILETDLIVSLGRLAKDRVGRSMHRHGTVDTTDASFDQDVLARRFALSLLPIAIVYQLSHYFTSLLLQGQYLYLSLLDPFGFGWNPLGLASFEPTGQIPFLSVQLVWQLQVGLIVIGHVIAVWVAHQIAVIRFEERTQAIKSQLPMMAVMVLYTIAGLLLLTRATSEPMLP